MMRASYKNTSVALLVSFALSLFFVFAMKPGGAAGSTPRLRAESINPASLQVSLESIEMSSLVKTDDNDDDFEITISSATTNTIRTSVTCSLKSDKNTQHRIEFYTSPTCGSKGLENA